MPLATVLVCNKCSVVIRTLGNHLWIKEMSSGPTCLNGLQEFNGLVIVFITFTAIHLIVFSGLYYAKHRRVWKEMKTCAYSEDLIATKEIISVNIMWLFRFITEEVTRPAKCLSRELLVILRCSCPRRFLAILNNLRISSI